VLEGLGEPLQLGESRLAVTASIGIALYPADEAVAERLIKAADTAMYRAKELGRNRYAFFAPEMNERLESQILAEAALRRAASYPTLRESSARAAIQPGDSLRQLTR
jgi:predicted signal transduction protein with EAL and GGDEF domain